MRADFFVVRPRLASCGPKGHALGISGQNFRVVGSSPAMGEC